MSKQATEIGPWHHTAWLRAGGLVAIGFPSDFHLFTLSWNGRSLFDLRATKRMARDHADPVEADWLAPDLLRACGIGEFGGRMIPIVGLWGGTGHTTTADGWRLDNRVVNGTVQSSALIDPTGSRIPLPLTSITEYRAISFNSSGQFLLLASSSEVQVLKRA